MAKNKQKTTQQPNKKPAEIILDLKVKEIIVISAACILSLLLAIYYVSSASGTNSFLGFPLDDPWIHLTFAKNLAEYGSFSYFKNEMTTAGSTSPLYTLILGAGFFITQNEMVLSYTLGIIFLLASVYFFFRLSSVEFGRSNMIALAATAVFVLDKWMNFISVSGMETTMFIFLLLLGAYFYRQRNPLPLGITLGLILWTRPDGIVFIIALAIDYFYLKYFAKDKSSEREFTNNELVKIAIPFAGIIVLYGIMNIVLSGTILPNTYNAKLTYYSPEFRSRADFLKFEVWEYFTQGGYAVLMAGFIIAIGFTLLGITKKKYNRNILYILFVIGLVAVYWLKLPYAHRFGRYMMPIIPFFILLGFSGFWELIKLTLKTKTSALGAFGVLSALILFLTVGKYMDGLKEYADECKYINDRQVAAAKWIRDNTNENDIIATHDVGAIAFYGNRKIVDAAGLVTPELITKLNDKNYPQIMSDYMKKSGVTYIALLQEWYRIVNQKPLFSTAPQLPPEVMEIYKFYPDSTHIMPAEAKSMNMYVENLLSNRQADQALQILSRSLSVDPKSSYTYYLFAFAYSLKNDMNGMERSLLKALELYPDYPDALLQLGNIYKSKGDFAKARMYLEKFNAQNPQDKRGQEILKTLPADTTGTIK